MEPAIRRRRQNWEWETQDISLPRTMSRNEATRLLTSVAADGRWELHRVRILPDGQRRIRLRRKIQRVENTFFYGF